MTPYPGVVTTNDIIFYQNDKQLVNDFILILFAWSKSNTSAIAQRGPKNQDKTNLPKADVLSGPRAVLIKASD
jgi:hypothetical protein